MLIIILSFKSKDNGIKSTSKFKSWSTECHLKYDRLEGRREILKIPSRIWRIKN